MKIILERSESEAEDLEYQPSDNEEEEEDRDVEDEADTLARDILRYRMLHAKGRGLTSPYYYFRYIKAMWSLLKNIGQTLRLLAPAALLAIICGKDSPVIRFFHLFDRALRNAFFPPQNQIEEILKWLKTSLPEDERVTSLDSVWADTTIICDLINSVIPGACPGHEDEEANLLHAQRLVEQYLGVSPIFSEEDISHKQLSTYQECRLSHYMYRIRDVITQMTPPISRAGTPLLNDQAYTLDYVARGMGIVTAYKDRRASFYVYPTAQQSLEPGDISVQIRGPGVCYGAALVPVIYGKTHVVRNVLLNLGKKQRISNTPLPITQGCSYIRDYDTNVKNKYFVPKIRNQIDVKILVKNDRVKVSYTPTLNGLHEISLTSKGCHIIGSPYEVNVEVPLAYKEESIDYSDDEFSGSITKTKRKVVFSVVDFVTEKMILTEDGNLEKISDEDAELLLETKTTINELKNKYLKLGNNTSVTSNSDVLMDNDITLPKKNPKKFKSAIKKVILILTICREFKKQIKIALHKHSIQIPQMTPDVVNSIVIDKSYFKDAEQENYPRITSASDLRQLFKSRHSSFVATTDESKEITQDVKSNNNNNFEREDPMKENDKNDSCQSESENTNESQNSQDMCPIVLKTNASIDIIISSFDNDDLPIFDDEDIPVPDSLPPILEGSFPEELIERPKTPLVKVLQTDEDNIDIKEIENEKRKVDIDGDFSLDYYINVAKSSGEDEKRQHFLNDDDHDECESITPCINFHIGAPVTPTGMFHSAAVEPDMDSIILASNLEEALDKYDQRIQQTMNDQDCCNSDDSDSSNFMTPMRQTPFEQMTDNEILKMYGEMVSNEENEKPGTFEQDNIFVESDTNSMHDFNIQKGGVNIIHKRLELRRRALEPQDTASSTDDDGVSNYSTYNNSVDTWDSAYVSIDEVNSSPDSNKSNGNNVSPKVKLFSITENSQESNATPTWELLHSNQSEENETRRNRAECEIQKENEFNKACNETNSPSYSKSLKTNPRSISVIQEDDSYSSSSNKHELLINNNIDYSASDLTADVKQSPIKDKISSFQRVLSEMTKDNDSSKIDSMVGENVLKIERKIKNDVESEKQRNKNRISKMVSEKRDYWDNKIKLMQCKENKKGSTVTKKRCGSMKKYDSQSRKKGKQLLAKPQNITELWKTSFEPKHSGGCAINYNLVARWKTYWNEKAAHVDQDEQCGAHKTSFQSLHNMYNSDESSTTQDDQTKIQEHSKAESLGMPKENDEIYYACDDSNMVNDNILASKYQPRPINLQCVTERIEKFLTSLPAPSPANETEELRFSTPEAALSHIVEKSINTFDSNNNHMNKDNILKIDHDKDKLRIIWNDCQSRKRFEALQLLSASSTPDITNLYNKELGNKTTEETNIEGNEENEPVKNTSSIYEMENLSSYPIVAKMKAEIESLKNNQHISEPRKKFAKYRSKTFDDSKQDKTIFIKKAHSITRIQNDWSKSENNLDLMKAPSISDLRKTFERNISREKINLNISTESIPSLKNRKLRLEKYLQSKIANMEMNNVTPVNNITLVNNNDIQVSTNRSEEDRQANVVEFKPIGNIVKSFENRKDEKATAIPSHIPDINEHKGKANQGRVLETVAEKGEGAQEHRTPETFLLTNAEDLGKVKSLKNHSKHPGRLQLPQQQDFTQNIDKRNSKITSPVDLEVIKFEYKDRFQKAKSFFQQLDKKQSEKVKVSKKKLNECEMLLLHRIEEKERIEEPSNIKATKRSKTKALSTASDTEYEMCRRAWTNAVQYSDQPKLRKISESFMVEGLYRDIMGETGTSTGYAFKGIPHKSAVLAAFRSMEDVNQPSSYEITVSQMEDFAKKNGIVNAQVSYHSDYPHLPMTEPNKYRSRYDALASGMIRREDILKSAKIRRRYSEPNRLRRSNYLGKEI